jgi:hypothetical protein
MSLTSYRAAPSRANYQPEGNGAMLRKADWPPRYISKI